MGIPSGEVVHPEEVSDILRCLICTDVLLDPLECTECQTAYCRSCIGAWLMVKHSCPHCKATIHHEGALQPLHRSLRTELAKVRVTCPKAGCTWRGRLDHRPGHECFPDVLAARDARIAELEAELEVHRAMVSKLEARLGIPKLQIKRVDKRRSAVKNPFIPQDDLALESFSPVIQGGEANDAVEAFSSSDASWSPASAASLRRRGSLITRGRCWN
mmetsp:Transcript_56525/g.104652  ORF Transcript_56525/g.104652 Transcript_56525/m.104652 type:complete len:216 (-) Transcript_56525:280-927(-)